MGSGLNKLVWESCYFLLPNLIEIVLAEEGCLLKSSMIYYEYIYDIRMILKYTLNQQKFSRKVFMLLIIRRLTSICVENETYLECF